MRICKFLLCGVLILLFVVVCVVSLGVPFNEHITQSSLPPPPTPPCQKLNWLCVHHDSLDYTSRNYSNLDIHDLCAMHNWPRYDKAMRIIDTFLLNSEIPALLVRLGELYHFVDYFIVVEANYTFSGNPKPFHLSENWAYLARFHDKIISCKIQDEPSVFGASPWWDREEFLMTAAFGRCLSLVPNMSHRDLLLYSDIDELPKPLALFTIRHCDFKTPSIGLNGNLYYYSYEWWSVEFPIWHLGPRATRYKGATDTMGSLRLRRMSHQSTGMITMKSNWSWHCSSCFPLIANFINKIESYSHQEHNKAEVKTRKHIVNVVSHGLDLFLRNFSTFTRVGDNKDIPFFVSNNREAFQFMLERNFSNASFIDF